MGDYQRSGQNLREPFTQRRHENLPQNCSSVTIDLHKIEDTNGCIYIADRNHTPSKDEKDADGKRVLDSWEPKLIVDILTTKGMAPEDVKKHRRYHLGIVFTVKIQ